MSSRLSNPHLTTALGAFLLPPSLILWIVATGPIPILGALMRRYWFWLIHFYAVFIHLFFLLLNNRTAIKHKTNLHAKEAYQVSWRSILLGHVLALGLGTSVIAQDETYRPFGMYLIIWSTFHMGEYLVTAIYNRSSLSLDSFLIDHSVEYYAAMGLCWTEFFLERYFVASLNTNFTWISIVGLIICLVGDFIRKLAMITAGDNFSHIIRTRKDPRHRLVTHGIYGWVRHPSYLGWFLWAVGTQLILINPFSIIVFTLATWKFFSERIHSEERILIQFFQYQYTDYQGQVPFSGVPFVPGYILGQEANQQLHTNNGHYAQF